jgi:hypothetical protein
VSITSTDPEPVLHQLVARELVGAVIAEAGATEDSARVDRALAVFAALPGADRLQAAVDIALTAAEALALLGEKLGIPTADAFAWVLLQRERKVTP